jgi:Flp pilus assembly protein TadG
VECAVVFPALFVLLFGLIVGAMGVFRYQEVAHLAREGARYASTHGGRYHQDGIDTQTGVSAISTSSDMATYLAAKTILLDSSKLTVTATWTGAGSVTPSNYPTYMDTDPTLVPPGQKVIQNYVIVTVSYQWFPEAYLVGPITLQSTSEMPMSY